MVQIDLLFKLAGLGVVVAVLCQVLTRAGREELSTLVTVVRLLLQGQFGAAALLEQCAPELMKTMNSALSTSDYYYDALVRVMKRVRYRDWNMRMEGSCGCW